MTNTAQSVPFRSQVQGTISSAAFESGDQFVIGSWSVSPVGPICDVMWLDPDDNRTLLASSDAAAEFITSIYEFDQVHVIALDVESDGKRTTVASDRLDIELTGGFLRPLPLRRPLWFTRHIEAPIARARMGVETYGTSPTGAREWYQSRGWRWVTVGRATIAGHDLGSLVPNRTMNVGFSNPPSRASIVAVTVTIDQ